MSRSTKTIEIIFILLIIFASCTGLMSYIYSLTGQSSLSGAYGVYSSDGGIGGVILKYGRDVLVVILLFRLLLSRENLNSIPMLFISTAFIYSVIVGVLNSLDYRYYICGIREFIYAAVAVFIFVSRKRNNMIIDRLSVILPILLAFQSVAQIILIVTYSGKIDLGVTRLPGLSNSAIALGYFSTGIAVACTVLYQYFRKYKLWQCIVIMCGCTFLSITAGTRTAMICNFILLMVILVNNVSNDSRIRWGLIIFGVFIIVPAIISYSVSLAGRGELIESGHMRIEFFGHFFSYTDLFQKLFGCGLGALTNNAANMQLSPPISGFYYVVDSTWGLILGQFGMVGLVVFAFLIIDVIRKVIFNKIFSIDNALIYAIIAVGFITMSGTNVFEQSLFGLLYIWSLCSIIYFREIY